MERIYTKSDLVEMWKRPLAVQYQVAIPNKKGAKA